MTKLDKHKPNWQTSKNFNPAARNLAQIVHLAWLQFDPQNARQLQVLTAFFMESRKCIKIEQQPFFPIILKFAVHEVLFCQS